jgi:hypothetical protein
VPSETAEPVLIGSSAPTKKPYAKKRIASADRIHAWSTAEFDAGSYYPDQQDAIKQAINKGLKAEKLG